jgi:capsular exopolysaccharide synthesis family protein
VSDQRDDDDSATTLTLGRLWQLFGRNPRLVIATVLAFLAGAVVVLAGREPVYRDRATLILEDGASEAGVLGELAMLGKAPIASSQIEILRARSTAEETVAAPAVAPGELAHSDELERHLALTTLVDDPSLAPLRALARWREPAGRLPPRLRARVQSDDEFGAPERIEVEFLARDRVRLSEPGLLGSRAEIEAALDGRPIEFEGCRVQLWPEADLTGRTYEIRRLTREAAIRRVMLATRAKETERNSGVIEVVYDDTDPRRAAETANALCKNYFARNEQRGDRRATRTIDFIDDQLAAQSASLSAAEDEVVRLQRENPRAIDVAKSAEALIEELSQLEVQRMQLELSGVTTRQALQLLEQGDVDALSRLSVELGDPITATYLESLAKLSAEHALQGRSDAGQFKLLLQQRTLELEAQLDATELAARDLEAAIAALDAGDYEAVARLGGGAPAARDPLLEAFLGSLGELEARAVALRRDLTPEHPDRLLVERRIHDTCARIRALLAARLDGRRDQREEEGRLLASYRERNQGLPEDERRRIDEALASLRRRVGAHLDSRLRGIEQSVGSLAGEVTRIEASLGGLPEEERRIADPLRRLAAHTEIVKLLLARQQEAAITKASSAASAEFIDLAVPPVERTGPSIPLHLLAGLILGAIAALGLAFAKEALVRNVFTASELELASGLAVLGTVPDFRRGRFRVRGAGAHFVPLRDDADGASADAFRSLRANLKFTLAADEGIRSIASTSCTAGEGKSSTNVALALAFARSGRRVVLVDCDMRKPSVEKYLRLALRPGLSDVLSGALPWREALQRAGERLDVISAGAQPQSPSDLLDGEGFARLLSELEREYDLVVCDVPPALAVSDIESCASRIDALLLVARSDRVTAETLAATTKRLKQAGARLIGAVLNGVGTSIANGRYGYGYGYGTGNQRDRAAS